MYKSVVYEGDRLLGEVEVYPQNQNQNGGGGSVVDVRGKEFRISHFSKPSERCPPLAVLHTITSSGICFKMESKSQSHDSPLYLLHSSCIRDNKTAVMLVEGSELHLVAMSTRSNDGRCPCFWVFNVALGLYNSCLVMLNLRCLGIVFDLDETLIVANTMRSFEDRIEALQRKIATEADPQRISGMLAEVKRYQDDKILLKQYAENDQVVENGKVIISQSEVVPAMSDNHQTIVRPLIRLQDKNIILTRINPLIRDTSVLVRLRPAWEDLRSYLTARGRKRFEVYVCTMAERDYALEMWRLLDPDSNLINPKDLFDRIVSVKSGEFHLFSMNYVK
ncbi:RNA polymerase II C-terminal domain phosphatase-like 1 [Sarracenia purpurea var. burkii]